MQAEKYTNYQIKQKLKTRELSNRSQSKEVLLIDLSSQARYS